jgi:site-specific recombinase XerC
MGGLECAIPLIFLATQRKVSPHTVASYRDTFRLLLQFAQKRLRKAPLSCNWTTWMPLWSARFWKIWKTAGVIEPEAGTSV